MKKVTILFKSGNKLVLKCKVFDLQIEGERRNLTMESDNYESWMFDLNQIESVITKRCWCWCWCWFWPFR